MADDINAFSQLEDYFLHAHKGELYPVVIEIIEKKLIERVLEHFSGNQIEASKMLGIHRNTLHSKIRKLRINIERYKA